VFVLIIATYHTHSDLVKEVYVRSLQKCTHYTSVVPFNSITIILGKEPYTWDRVVILV